MSDERAQRTRRGSSTRPVHRPAIAGRAGTSHGPLEPLPPDWRAIGSTSDGGARLRSVLWGVAIFLVTIWAVPVLNSYFHWADAVSSVFLSIALTIGAVLALVAVKPKGLLRFRTLDLMWGLAAGISLRMVNGWIQDANAELFPRAPIGNGLHANEPWITTTVMAAAVGPLTEEFFFRAAVLVLVFSVSSRSLGTIAAGVVAMLVSAATFCLTHMAFAPISLLDATQLILVALICGLLTILTGRIWAAVLAHACYNATFLALSIAGAVLALE